jgi:hypothetical protein
MWRRTVVICLLPFALAACAADPAPAPKEPTPTTTTTTTETPISDADLLHTLLGQGSPRCPAGTASTNTTCGELMSSSKKLVDLVDVALDSMPTTGPYTAVNEAVSSFTEAYTTLESTKCYTPAPVSGIDDSFCQTLADLVALSWLNLQSTIDQLR